MKIETGRELAQCFYNLLFGSIEKSKESARKEAIKWICDETLLKATREFFLIFDNPKAFELIQKALEENVEERKTLRKERYRKIFKTGLLRCDIQEEQAEKMTNLAYPPWNDK